MGATRRGFRADIQALRALAVVLVLLYHLWPNRLPGGFVGVDVFFVISGFLIGGHLLAELEGTGRIRLRRFWARRVRRLLPASLLVLAVVTVGVVTLTPLSLRHDSLEQVVGSALYVQNWVLAGQSVDYLALGDTPAPVQHYWSLAVEEQLYVALPLLLVAGLLATRRRRRRWPMGLIGVAAAVSLAWSVVNTGSDPGIAYFSTLTRAWEFLAGALLTALPRVLAPGVGRVAGWVGLAAILASALLLDGGSAFPGAVALVPVLGSVAVIAAGDRGPVALASRWRPITWTGDVSYAVYLWHWPLIVLVPFATNAALSTTHKVLIMAATLGLAAVSTSLVEQPLLSSRRWRSGWPARAVVAGCLSMSVVVAGVASYGARDALREQEEQLAAAQERLDSGDVRCLGAAAMDPRVTGCDEPEDLLLPSPASAAIDNYNLPECWASFGDSELRLCRFGSSDPRAPRVLAVGDSHNNVFLPAYEIMADRLGWQMEVAGRASCSWSDRPQGGGPSASIVAECNGWKKALQQHLAESPPYDLILTTEARHLALPDAGESAQAATVAGYHDAWARQVERGTAVLAIRGYPIADPDVVQCVEEHLAEAVTECARSRSDAIQGFDALARAVRSTPGTALVDLRDLMCTDRACLPVIGHVVVYRDRGHLTATFVRTLAPYLIERVVEARRQARAERVS